MADIRPFAGENQICSFPKKNRSFSISDKSIPQHYECSCLIPALCVGNSVNFTQTLQEVFDRAPLKPFV